jgi:hypothetical protein
MTSNQFYETHAFDPDFDFTQLPENESDPPLRTERVPVASLLTAAAALTFAGMLILTPPGGLFVSMTMPAARASRGSAQGIQRVSVPEAHRQSAERFRKLFRAVPLNDVEKLPDPDFGL